ncbi:guanylate kinase [Linnemannia zychae]|nr:guanylate kinase [Linnemannia zychae]
MPLFPVRALIQLGLAPIAKKRALSSLYLAERFLSTQNISPLPADRRTIVVSGPSGGGKSTLLERLFHEYPSTFGFSVSHTTRKPRPGEVDGVSYHFVTQDVVNDMIAQNQFLEHAVFSGNTYGSSRKAVQDVKDAGKICIMDIELQGVKQMKALAKKDQQVGPNGFEARYLLVRPPSLDILEKRLRERGTETEESIAKRLEAARRDWDAGSDPTIFESIIINDDLDRAYEELCQFIFSKKPSSSQK